SEPLTNTRKDDCENSSSAPATSLRHSSTSSSTTGRQAHESRDGECLVSSNGRLRVLWPSEEDVVPILAPRRDGLEPSRGQERRCPRPPRLPAAAFPPERMLRRPGRPPGGGWRRTVYVLSSQKVSIPPSAAELHRREFVAQLTRPIIGCRTVAFVSRKG